MFQYIVFCLIFGSTFIDCSNVPKFGGRIIGGELVDIEEYPHQVSIETLTKYGAKIFCGGSIIGDGSLILTDSYCVHSAKPKNIKVRAGSSFYRKGGQKMKIEKVIADDKVGIAVLKLTKKIKVSSKTKPIELNTNEINAEALGTVLGWGLPGEYGKKSEQLKKVSIEIVSKDDCEKLVGKKLTDEWFCAGGGGKGAYREDTGGPFIVDGEQVGILHGGVDDKKPSFFIKLSNPKIAKWIEDTIAILSEN